ncbi:DUF4145 domain-containing protein [Mucilaginibacter sp. L3T2-6]|uniref:DUF4145 domain-containing protein n=1 Tax=Mucilaginibacter sp. L3T2-6 TaxID=3062491 RepID=UPI0026759055|nr:DUF4145 domain-containing protein [Mucilaginibacter sp. L3T2-6]MDO3641923.1 DUF4145 domain-containing protein [Mucilaginibacter sp. L3T2-6]MDV6214399.1 DUF4145 domain-containing protein [Mucilaginibacter sp. L3T2-6]
MYYKVAAQESKEPSTTRVVSECPFCQTKGTFDILSPKDLWLDRQAIAGIRYCPNQDCRGLIFFILTGKGLNIYPPIKISINREKIPGNIIKIFDEAVTCHATECYIASGMMLRKTLEAICEDKKAPGANLHQKLRSLSKLITVPNALIDSMQVLKLMGNDAAHIVAKDFEEIGKNEIEISIELVKEILKAVYQLDDLLEKLNKLRKVPNDASTS